MCGNGIWEGKVNRYWKTNILKSITAKDSNLRDFVANTKETENNWQEENGILGENGIG